MKKRNLICSNIKTDFFFTNKKLILKLHLEFIKLAKKENNYKMNKMISSIQVPLFYRKISIFRVSGILRKKHYSKNSMNQTITLECVVSKNKFWITSPLNANGISVN